MLLVQWHCGILECVWCVSCGTNVCWFALNVNQGLQQRIVVVIFIEAVFGRKMAGEVPRSVLRSDVKCLWGLGWEGNFGKRECWSLWKMSIALKDELCDVV